MSLIRSRYLLALAYLVAGVAWVLGSDAILGEAGQMSVVAHVVGTAKGIAFVVASAVLLFVILSWPTAPHRAAAAGGAPRPRPLRPLLIFLVAALSVTLAGVVLYRQLAAEVHERAGDSLASTAELTARQLELWLDGRRTSLEYTGRNPLLAGAIAVRRQATGAGTGGHLESALEVLRLTEEFERVQVFTPDGAPLASSGGAIAYSGSLGQWVRGAEATGRVVMSDLYVPPDAASGDPVIDFVVAISDEQHSGQWAGVLVARADPARYLFATLPDRTSTNSGVILSLARRQGSAAALMLTRELAAGGEWAVSFKPLQPGTVASQVIGGRQGVFEALDHRDRPMLATGRAIAGTPWYLVAKTELRAVYAPLRGAARLAILLSLAGLLTSGLLVLLWWRSERLSMAMTLAAAQRREHLLKEHFAIAGRFVHDLVLLLDAQTGRILEANDRALEAYGYSREEILATTFFDLSGPEPDAVGQSQLRFAAILADGAGHFHAGHRRRDGTNLPLEISARTCDIDGRRYIQAICRDITERLEQDRRYRSLTDISPVGIFRCDLEGRIVFVNRRACAITGLDAAASIGRGWARAVHPVDAPRVAAAWSRYLRSGGPVTYVDEFRFVRADATVVWMLAQAAPEYDGEGRIVAHVGTVTDVTALKTAQLGLQQARDHLEDRVAERTRELERAKEAAEHSDRVKTAFLSTMSHELRTPLNAILGFTDVILQGLAGPVTPDQVRQLGIVRNSAVQLRALIEDVLDVSRIEAGQIGLEYGELDLRELVARSVASFGADAARKGIELTLDAPMPSLTIRGDARRTTQIVNNLVSNAVKFTDRGQVRVTLQAAAERVVLAVADTGIGIDPAGLERLFNPFTQVHRPGGRLHAGTGLGLAISRELACALGGGIEVRSVVGAGSCFTFWLPIVADAAPGQLPGEWGTMRTHDPDLFATSTA